MSIGIDELFSDDKETVLQGDCLGKETVGEAKQTVPKASKKEKKKKMKPRGGNSPMIGNNGLQLEPGDNQKYLAISMQLMKLPKINLKDEEAVKNRLDEYFQIHYEHDCKPTVAGMAMALGIDRRRLWEIRTGNIGRTTPILPPSIQDCIKKAYFIMENLWENYMLNGKINPVSGIFLGKNNYGYQDKTEYVLTPNSRPDDEYSAEDIKSRYLLNDSEKE